MDEKVISALELFKRFHNRYPVIQMEPVGFSKDFASTRFLLNPMRGGVSLGLDQRIVDYPYIDIVRAGLEPLIKIPTGVSPRIQMEAKYTEIIRELLSKRRFTMRLCRNVALLPSYYSIPLREKPNFPVTFTSWPAVGRGLVINPSDIYHRAYLHWSAFVPEGTVEYRAISKAIELSEMAHTKPLKSPPALIQQLQEQLHEYIVEAA